MKRFFCCFIFLICSLYITANELSESKVEKYNKAKQFLNEGIYTEYDEKGNQIHVKTNKDEYWNTFNQEGNCVYRLFSNGDERYYTYDSNNKLVIEKQYRMANNEWRIINNFYDETGRRKKQLNQISNSKGTYLTVRESYYYNDEGFIIVATFHFSNTKYTWNTTINDFEINNIKEGSLRFSRLSENQMKVFNKKTGETYIVSKNF